MLVKAWPIGGIRGYTEVRLFPLASLYPGLSMDDVIAELQIVKCAEYIDSRCTRAQKLAKATLVSAY